MELYNPATGNPAAGFLLSKSNVYFLIQLDNQIMNELRPFLYIFLWQRYKYKIPVRI